MQNLHYQLQWRGIMPWGWDTVGQRLVNVALEMLCRGGPNSIKQIVVNGWVPCKLLWNANRKISRWGNWLFLWMRPVWGVVVLNQHGAALALY